MNLSANAYKMLILGLMLVGISAGLKAQVVRQEGPFEGVVDSLGTLDIHEVAQVPSAELGSIEGYPTAYDPTLVYWLRVEAPSADSINKWFLQGYTVGLADFYVRFPGQEEWTILSSGTYSDPDTRIWNRSHFTAVPIQIPIDGPTPEVWVRISEIDHNPIHFRFYWHDAQVWGLTDHDPHAGIYMAFLGMCLMMGLYNIVVFFMTRFWAFFHYALYLLCVFLFVLFAVGPMRQVPFGEVRLLLPWGYLGFGCINICYFLFARSLIDMKRTMPFWNQILMGYVWLKLTVIAATQMLIYWDFDLNTALNIEFAMLVVDVCVLMVLYVVWFRQGFIARVMVMGSALVTFVGLSLAAIGHIYAIPNSLIFFLSAIIVEIILFSLVLGYRMKKEEEERLAAERKQRIYQETLNQELSKVNSVFGRFVPHEFLKSLGKDSVLDVKLGDGVEKVVTVMFVDIRSYTTLAEQMTPRENFNFLNAYLGRVGPAIKAQGGFVNQYYGDGIMALFLDAPEASLKAARDMFQILDAYNAARKEKGRIPISIGIGIHTGPLLMGVIGDTLRMEAGVVSDTVNTAARMEGLTKHYHARIVLSENTFRGLSDPDTFGLRVLAKVRVKGRSNPLEIYECLDAWPDHPRIMRLASKAQFQEALQHYWSGRFSESTRLFDQLVEQDPSDPLLEQYRISSLNMLAEGAPVDWDGVTQMQAK
ncbi:adenylate/guanylate cyclase domain-containing protein [Pontibacter sp. G13]|uniref:adenylate/guanylate cyclase domain-containing protein n=1 Tax=Pontibacter sp. G13 TaxID=3074898 RepID=UPI00288AD6FC|nr:adenylate/guanylate cyclase domain-containing protein [Pontibacter sp. G13]WNJ18883.1 adenylate/guanylate cyclase domain-containing protein [Pontibacter sp. G13]